MAAFTVRTALPVNAGGIDPHYTRVSDRAYWTVEYTDKNGVRQKCNYHGPKSVKDWLESEGVRFDTNSVKVEFHKP